MKKTIRIIAFTFTSTLFYTLTAAQSIVAENDDAFAIESVGTIIFPFVHRSSDDREVINHEFLINEAKKRGCLALSYGPDYNGAKAAVRGFADESESRAGRDFKRENGLYIRLYEGKITYRTHTAGTRVFVCHKTEAPLLPTSYFTVTSEMERRFNLERQSK